MKSPLPPPAADAAAASQQLLQRIQDEIRAQGGWISFARYWSLALFTPGLGYYAGGAQKFGTDAEGGDFVTAPELTPLFGQTLARQVAEITAASAPVVLEAGAGTGRLAADLLISLDAAGAAPEKYLILEVSGELRQRQQATLAMHAPQLAHRVNWLDEMPEAFSGCVIGNEVLDAMPVHALTWNADDILEQGVALDGEGRLTYADRPAGDMLRTAAAGLPVASPYSSEIGLAGQAWVAAWGERLVQGALLLIDYGLPRHEYYHPQRNGGTVRCHYRHRSHDDPFWYPGLCDITAHVDFTAIAEAGFEAGLDVLGYISQSGFLMNCGITELMALRQQADTPANVAKATGALNLLLSPNEMGELFKVIALGKGLPGPLLGFHRGDRTHTL